MPTPRLARGRSTSSKPSIKSTNTTARNVTAAFTCLSLIFIIQYESYVVVVRHHESDNNAGMGRYGPEPRDPLEKTYGSFEGNKVLNFDLAALKNIEATYDGAHSYTNWESISTIETTPPDEKERIDFQVLPLSATVDRRPIIVRKQIMDDDAGKKLANGGKLLGCAVTSTTFVSDLEYQTTVLTETQKQRSICQVCFEFSNREDMAHFIPSAQYHGQDDSTATKCFRGETTITAKFAKWQQTDMKNDSRFHGFGYPWTVDCILPNGVPELTCRGISQLQRSMGSRDDLKSIHFQTKFVMDVWQGPRHSYKPRELSIHSKWPWAALMSHDDDRSKIAMQLGTRLWDDKNSWYVPQNADDLKLAQVTGPGFDETNFEGELSLKSVNLNPSSHGGIHVRFLVNMFHLIRNAPGSTHIIAVVDGQAHRSYDYIIKLLTTKMSVLYPEYWQSMVESIVNLKPKDLIPISRMKHASTNTSLRSQSSDITLMEVLRIRHIKIDMVPMYTPSLLFEKSVCGGQYPFTTYLAARYAADYQVMSFVDGDTVLIEKLQTQQRVLYDRFFSQKSTRCAGNRLRLIEQYVKPEDENENRVLQCTHDTSVTPSKWEYAMKNCHLKQGHIVARTDSIYAFNVHHPDTLSKYLPIGLEDCISPGNTRNDRYFLKETEIVQLHLRNRQRKLECTCFVNEES